MALQDLHRDQRWSNSSSASSARFLACQLVFLCGRTFREESPTRCRGNNILVHPVRNSCTRVLPCQYRSSYDIHPHLSSGILYLCDSCNMWLREPPDTNQSSQARPGRSLDAPPNYDCLHCKCRLVLLDSFLRTFRRLIYFYGRTWGCYLRDVSTMQGSRRMAFGHVSGGGSRRTFLRIPAGWLSLSRISARRSLPPCLVVREDRSLPYLIFRWTSPRLVSLSCWVRTGESIIGDEPNGGSHCRFSALESRLHFPSLQTSWDAARVPSHSRVG